MAEAPKQGRKSALLIGINQYDNSYLADLRGCLTDVTVTERFLTEIAGISAITRLTSPRASPEDPLPTLENILSAFQALARDAQPGDFIYIHYSGHGTRLSTKFGDLKGDNVCFDECLVLARGDHRVDYLRDVEIAFLLKQIADKGAMVTFVLDCCHSGGATRDGDDDNEGVRGSEDIPEENFFDLNRKPIGSAEDLEAAWGLPPDDGDDGGRGGTVAQHWMTASKGINFFAACQPRQKAQEVPRTGQVRKGLFTDCLVKVITENRGPDRLGQLSCDAVYNLASDELRKHPLKNRSRDQGAVFGGQGDRYIFGIESVVQPTVVVHSIEKLVGGKLKVGLSAGVAHGVREDDIFAIYPIDRPLSSLADYSAPLATCSVTAVEDFASKAHIQPNAANLERVEVGCAAVSLRDILRDHVLQPKGVWVSPADNSPEPLDALVQRVRDSIGRGSKLVRLKDSGEAFFKVLVRGEDSFTISFIPKQAKAEVEVVGTTEDLVSRLIHLTVFYNLFSLADNSARQEHGLTASKIGYLDKDVKPPGPRRFPLDKPPPRMEDLKHLPPDSIDILEGQSLGIQVRNTSQEHLYVEILDLEPSWRVIRTYPMPRQSPILIPPNEGTYFFITMSPSDEVPSSVQPDTFDRFVVLATSRDRLNFPRDILPSLGKRVPANGSGDGSAPSVLEPDDGDGGRAGDGVVQPGWFVQQLDVRVVREE